MIDRSAVDRVLAANRYLVLGPAETATQQTSRDPERCSRD
jgi:hypothetical protein